jgi:hypothetical protein
VFIKRVCDKTIVELSVIDEKCSTWKERRKKHCTAWNYCVSGGCVVMFVTVLLGIYLRGNNPTTNRKKK